MAERGNPRGVREIIPQKRGEKRVSDALIIVNV